MTFFRYFTIIVEQYLVPFIFAIGLIFFIYAIIKYFIIGATEEHVREEGRLYFIKANVWFFLGLMVYLVVSLLAGFIAWTGSLSVDRDEEVEVLNVPNVPEENE